MKRYALTLCGMAMLGCLGYASTVHAHERLSIVRQVAGFGVPVSKDKLDTVRGGFDLGNGLQVSFGIQRAVYVDGNLVAYINVTIPDLAHITAQQATSLAEALGTVDVQVGKGNTYAPSSVTSFANSTVQSAVNSALNGVSSAGAMSPSTQANAATVIQNTVNNQVISSLTTLNVAISALNAMRSQALQQSLQNAQQLQALSH